MSLTFDYSVAGTLTITGNFTSDADLVIDNSAAAIPTGSAASGATVVGSAQAVTIINLQGVGASASNNQVTIQGDGTLATVDGIAAATIIIEATGVVDWSSSSFTGVDTINTGGNAVTVGTNAISGISSITGAGSIVSGAADIDYADVDFASDVTINTAGFGAVFNVETGDENTINTSGGTLSVELNSNGSDADITAVTLDGDITALALNGQAATLTSMQAGALTEKSGSGLFNVVDTLTNLAVDRDLSGANSVTLAVDTTGSGTVDVAGTTIDTEVTAIDLNGRDVDLSAVQAAQATITVDGGTYDIAGTILQFVDGTPALVTGLTAAELDGATEVRITDATTAAQADVVLDAAANSSTVSTAVTITSVSDTAANLTGLSTSDLARLAGAADNIVITGGGTVTAAQASTILTNFDTAGNSGANSITDLDISDTAANVASQLGNLDSALNGDITSITATGTFTAAQARSIADIAEAVGGGSFTGDISDTAANLSGRAGGFAAFDSVTATVANSNNSGGLNVDSEISAITIGTSATISPGHATITGFSGNGNSPNITGTVAQFTAAGVLAAIDGGADADAGNITVSDDATIAQAATITGALTTFFGFDTTDAGFNLDVTQAFTNDDATPETPTVITSITGTGITTDRLDSITVTDTTLVDGVQSVITATVDSASATEIGRILDSNASRSTSSYNVSLTGAQFSGAGADLLFALNAADAVTVTSALTVADFTGLSGYTNLANTDVDVTDVIANLSSVTLTNANDVTATINANTDLTSLTIDSEVDILGFLSNVTATVNQTVINNFTGITGTGTVTVASTVTSLSLAGVDLGSDVTVLLSDATSASTLTVNGSTVFNGNNLLGGGGTGDRLVTSGTVDLTAAGAISGFETLSSSGGTVSLTVSDFNSFDSISGNYEIKDTSGNILGTLSNAEIDAATSIEVTNAVTTAVANNIVTAAGSANVVDYSLSDSAANIVNNTTVANGAHDITATGASVDDAAAIIAFTNDGDNTISVSDSIEDVEDRIEADADSLNGITNLNFTDAAGYEVDLFFAELDGATVTLSSGNDTLNLNLSSTFDGGTIDGGAGTNVIETDLINGRGGSLDLRGTTLTNINTVNYGASSDNIILVDSDTRLNSTAINSSGSGAAFRFTGTLNTSDLGSTGLLSYQGSSSADTITGDGDNETFSVYDGNDSVDAGAGNDIIFGGAGNDTIIGGAGDNTMHGGSGSDVFRGTYADLDGDTIADIGSGDRIVITDAALVQDEVTFASGTLTLDAVAAATDATVRTIDLDGATAVSFTVSNDGTETTITFSSVSGTSPTATPTPSAPPTPTPVSSGDSGSGDSGSGDSGSGDSGSGDSGSGDSGSGGGSTPSPTPTTPAPASPPASGTATSGPDVLQLPDGGSTVGSGDGDDTITGGNGDDLISASFGNDNASGGFGDDLIFGGDGDDFLTGGPGADSIEGGDDNDQIFAGSGDDAGDEFQGNGGDDVLGGNVGNDLLIGGSKLVGAVTSPAEADGDTLFGGDGNDTLILGDFDDLNSDGNFDAGEEIIVGTTASPGGVAYAGSGSDYLSGTGGADEVGGGRGSDTIVTGGGNDAVFGGQGGGADSIVAGGGVDLVFAGAGNDTLDGGGGADDLFGGSGNDVITAGGGQDEIFGGAGDDTIDPGNGADILYFAAGHGDDVVNNFSVSDDVLFVANATTTFTSFADIAAAATTTADGVLISTGGGDSVLLTGVSIADLSAANFDFTG